MENCVAGGCRYVGACLCSIHALIMYCSWLTGHGTLPTPHAQCSEVAEVRRQKRRDLIDQLARASSFPISCERLKIRGRGAIANCNCMMMSRKLLFTSCCRRNTLSTVPSNSTYSAGVLRLDGLSRFDVGNRFFCWGGMHHIGRRYLSRPQSIGAPSLAVRPGTTQRFWQRRSGSSKSGGGGSNPGAKGGESSPDAASTQTFLQRFLSPKPMPPRNTPRWYAEMLLICTVFGITGSSTMFLVRPAVSEGLGLQGNFRDGEEIKKMHEAGCLCCVRESL